MTTKGPTFRGLGGEFGIQLNEANERATAVSRMDLDDAVFHYTTAEGLLGILSSGQLWSTAHVATNDETEFTYGQGVLASTLEDGRAAGHMNERVDAALKALDMQFAAAAARFEEDLVFVMDHFVTAYVTSFCRARSAEDYLDGRLSQWRGYGDPDGYAIEFSRSKLQKWIGRMGTKGFAYGLHDVFYERDNPVRPMLAKTAEAVSGMFAVYLEHWAAHKDFPLFVNRQMSGRAAMYDVFMTMPEALEVIRTYFAYLASTKKPAFREEAEVRVSVYIMRQKDKRPVACFVRKGTLVPYIASPRRNAKELLAAISCIIIGPGSGVAAKMRGLTHYVRARGLDNIRVRTSAIPLS